MGHARDGHIAIILGNWEGILCKHPPLSFQILQFLISCRHGGLFASSPLKRGQSQPMEYGWDVCIGLVSGLS